MQGSDSPRGGRREGQEAETEMAAAQILTVDVSKSCYSAELFHTKEL